MCYVVSLHNICKGFLCGEGCVPNYKRPMQAGNFARFYNLRTMGTIISKIAHTTYGGTVAMRPAIVKNEKSFGRGKSTKKAIVNNALSFVY